MITTIFLPVSRSNLLDRMFAQLELMDCDANLTNLLVYVDGPDKKLFEVARNKTIQSKFAQKLCVASGNKTVISGIDRRRHRIASIKEASKELIGECDYVFSLEDDTLPPLNALKRLQRDYSLYPHAGFISGVTLGRWHIPHVGAWKVDDVYTPTKIESLTPAKGIQEVDAAGFYCYLTKREYYVNHPYEAFDGVLGPDVTFGLWLRQHGLKNYVDFDINCIHYTEPTRKKPSVGLSLTNTKPVKITFTKQHKRWVNKIDHLWDNIAKEGA